MNSFEETLYYLVKDLVADNQDLQVKQMSSVKENEILLYVYDKPENISRLIGKKGMTASAIRHLMIVAHGNSGKFISIKFESI